MSEDISPENQTIFIVDDDDTIKDFLITFFDMSGFKTQGFSSAEDYLKNLDDTPGCLVSDVLMPNMDGVQLLEQLNIVGHLRPTIFITGNATIPMSIQSMKLGANDFIEKPFKPEVLLEKVNTAISKFQKNLVVINKFKELTDKEQQTFKFMIKGHTNKMLAEDLGISPSTVEKHRASVMKKMQADSIVSLSKMAALLRPLGEEIKPKAIPPRELKKSIKKFKQIDMVSGVTRSRDKLHYSRPILEVPYVAVSKSTLNTKVNSISNLSSFNVIARTGSYARIKDGFSKLFHPKKGTHKNKYKEFDGNLNLHAEFWKPGSEKVLITTKEEFNHFRMLLASIYDTNDDVVINEIFPTKTRLYVAFKDKKLQKEFNEALEELKFEGTYSRIFDHYNYSINPDFRTPNRTEIIRQLNPF